MGIKDNILATMAYFDVLDMPLKAEEIAARLISFRHLVNFQFSILFTSPKQLQLQRPGGFQFKDVRKELDRLVLDGIASRAGEHYFLFNREYLVPLRLKHEKIAKHKWRKTQRAIRWLRLVPYVEAVFASGSLAINNTDELSDLDVLIVVRRSRIWLSRFFITVLLSILNIRRRAADRIAPNKICLNHYISDEALLIPFKSLYNAQTYANLVPIYIRSASLIEKFKSINEWVLEYVHYWNIKSVDVRHPRAVFAGVAEWLIEISGLGCFLNKIVGRYQSGRIYKNPSTNQPGGRVIFTDKQLEFHPRSIEASIIKKYNDNLIKLDMPELAIERDSGLIK